jgi:DNA-binding response OmpR family regulator
MFRPRTSHGRNSACKTRISEVARRRRFRSFAARRKSRRACLAISPEGAPSILLVHRDRTIRQTLCAALQDAGYIVIQCNDGRSAMQMLTEAQFDLVITGITMAGADGLELITSLRSRHSSPVIVAVADDSGKMSHIYLRLATLLGATSTQSHPVDPSILLTNVQWLLRGRTDVIKEIVW